MMRSMTCFKRSYELVLVTLFMGCDPSTEPVEADDTASGTGVVDTENGEVCYERDYSSVFGAGGSPVQFVTEACELPEPCPHLGFYLREDTSCMGPFPIEPAPPFDVATAACIVDSIRAGTPGSYSVGECPGGQYTTAITISVLEDQSLVWNSWNMQDLGMSARQTWRNLPTQEELGTCDPSTPQGFWDCIHGFADRASCKAGTPPCA